MKAWPCAVGSALLLRLLSFSGEGAEAGQPIAITLPAGHEIFSVVVDNADGVRVRNLLGMAHVADHGGSPAAPGGRPTVRIAWDGRDDFGNPAPAGEYTVRGLSLPRLRAEFDYAWYGPGNPAWSGYSGSGWGGDHTGPGVAVAIPAAAKSPHLVALGGPINEGGDGLFTLDEALRKQWSFKRGWAGPTAADADSNSLYVALWQFNTLVKLSCKDGSLQRWQRRAGAVQEVRMPGEVLSLAAGANTLAAVVKTGASDHPFHLLLLDKKGGETKDDRPLGGLARVAYHPDGTLFAAGSNGLFRAGSDGGLQPVSRRGLVQPGPFCFDATGRLWVYDEGPDRQIKVYDANGSPVLRIGTAGAQGQRLEYDREALPSVSDLDLDREGRLWVSEWAHPRRTSVWTAEGRFLRHFVGNTTYGASHCLLHEQDPALAAAYGMLFRINPAAVQEYEPLRLLTSGPKPDSPFTIDRSGGEFFRGTLLRSSASGTEHEYFVEVWAYGAVLFYRNGEGDFRPCAALLTPNWPVPEKIRSAPGFVPAAHLRLWSDASGDEQIQPEELQAVPDYPKTGSTWSRPTVGWTHPMREELGFYPSGQTLLPARFTAQGAPVYEVARAVPFADELDTAHGPFLRAGQHLVGCQNYAQPFHGQHVFTDLKGKVIARFQFDAQALHGSMAKGTMPKPGETCGEQFISGIADIGGELGSVVAYHGNYGQAFLFTEDGIYLSMLFRDVRDNPAPWGPEMKKGQDWTHATMTQEPFGGWFGKQADGQVRYLFGREAALVTRVLGLEKARRFEAGRVRIAAP